MTAGGARRILNFVDDILTEDCVRCKKTRKQFSPQVLRESGASKNFDEQHDTGKQQSKYKRKGMTWDSGWLGSALRLAYSASDGNSS